MAQRSEITASKYADILRSAGVGSATPEQEHGIIQGIDAALRFFDFHPDENTNAQRTVVNVSNGSEPANPDEVLFVRPFRIGARPLRKCVTCGKEIVMGMKWSDECHAC